MRLLIVSATPHYIDPDQQFVGWGPTVQEIDQLATIFEEVRHITFLYPGPPSPSYLRYQAKNVTVITVPPSGGEGFFDKLGILRLGPHYMRKVLEHLDFADVVHVRCPSSIGLMTLMLLAARRRPALRWVKYAGNWRPDGDEAVAYRVQRALLRHNVSRSRVTVNGRWDGDGDHVWSFINPCLMTEETDAARVVAASKQLRGSIRLLYVGRVEPEKGAGRAIEIIAALRKRGIDAGLDIVGDGPTRAGFENLARELGLREHVAFHGWLARTVLGEYYARAHFVLLPSTCSEGWPKVLSEGMAYGCVPISSTISSVPQFLSRFGTGRAVEPTEVAAYVAAIEEYVADPARWQRESAAAIEASQQFTYRRFLDDVRAMLGAELPARAPH